MSGLLALVPFPVVPWLTTFQLRARLAAAERGLDARFSRTASLELDRAVLRYEMAMRHERTRRGPGRRAA